MGVGCRFADIRAGGRGDHSSSAAFMVRSSGSGMSPEKEAVDMRGRVVMAGLRAIVNNLRIAYTPNRALAVVQTWRGFEVSGVFFSRRGTDCRA